MNDFQRAIDELNEKLKVAATFQERIDIAAQIIAMTKGMVVNTTSGLRKSVRESAPVVISQNIGLNYYMHLDRGMFRLISRQQMDTIGAVYWKEPFLWILEALDGRN